MAVDISQYVAQFGRNSGAPIAAGISRGIERGNRNRLVEQARQDEMQERNRMLAAQDKQAQQAYMQDVTRTLQSVATPEERAQVWQGAMQGAADRGWDISGDEQWDERMLPRLQGMFGVETPRAEQEQGPRFGTINPRDYTAESLAKYQQSGNFSDLERYESQRSVDIGGVPHRFDPATGGWYPAELNPSGGTSGGGAQLDSNRPQQITAGDVAKNEAERAAAVARAKKSAEQEVKEQDPEAVRALKSEIDEMGRASQIVRDMINHPGREAATGGSSWFYTRPGSDAADFEAKVEQLRGLAFLIQREKLRGTGTVTDFESGKAESALAALHLGMSEQAFLKELQSIEEVFSNVQSRKREQLEKLSQNSSTESAGGPVVGTEEGGYIFIGGDPSSPDSWVQRRQ